MGAERRRFRRSVYAEKSTGAANHISDARREAVLNERPWRININ